jgi:hypothetical protein
LKQNPRLGRGMLICAAVERILTDAMPVCRLIKTKDHEREKASSKNNHIHAALGIALETREGFNMKRITSIIAAAVLCAVLAGCTIVVENSGASAQPVSAQKVRGNGEVQTATGLYLGLADSNFFEVQTAGPEAAYKVFMITAGVREHFATLDLHQDDRVKVEYKENEFGQLETLMIERTEETE